tara:strand:+ start:357 stop:494 length:138 start_codon:yes stop_codon:yes gene_type:complete
MARIRTINNEYRKKPKKKRKNKHSKNLSLKDRNRKYGKSYKGQGR